MTEDQIAHHAEALTGVGGWLLDAGTHQLTWTAQTFRLHGLPPGSSAPQLEALWTWVDPLDRTRVRDAVMAALQTGRGCDLVYTLVLADGAKRRVRCMADFQRTPAGTGQLVGALQPLAEQQALAHEASLEFAVAAAGVGIWEMDLITGEERWSDQTLALYGLPPGTRGPNREEWRARFLHPDDRGRVDARGAEFMASRKPYELDYRIFRADTGALRWMHTRAAFAFGGERRVLGVTFDITEEWEARERARQAMHLLDHAATQVGFGFGYRNPGGETGEWSVQLKRLFGLSDDSPTPNRSQLSELISPQDRERVMRELGTRMAPGELREFEFEVVRGSNGQPRTLSTRAMTEYDDALRPLRTYFALLDVTDLRRKDRQLNQLLTRLQLATEASGIGTWEHDEQTGRDEWDALTLELFDLPPGSAGLNKADFLARVHPEDRDRVDQVLTLADQNAEPLDMNYRVVRPNGEVRWLRSRGRVERDEHGQAARSVGVCFDTTLLRDAEAAVQARVLAERANAAKTEFLSRMSHELRTPLNAVLGFAQLLAMDKVHVLSHSQRGWVDHIQSAGWHLLALVNDVLDVSRIESRQAQMALARVPLTTLLGECASMSEPLLQAQQVTMDVAQVDVTLQAWADYTRLKQVMLNLTSNAIKYNRPGGHVRLSAQPGEEGQIIIRVKDTGAGMTPEQMGSLFEPFNRLGRETSGIDGTGLGLAVAKLLVEQMGGSIHVHSAPGVGSEFNVALPSVPL